MESLSQSSCNCQLPPVIVKAVNGKVRFYIVAESVEEERRILGALQTLRPGMER